MPDEHNKSTELSLQTEGSLMTEQEIKKLNQPEIVDYPMPGEVAHSNGHEHQTLKEIEYEQKPKETPDRKKEEQISEPKEAKQMDCE